MKLFQTIQRWRDQWRFLRHAGRMLNRRVEVEQELFDCAHGKRPLPDAAQCRQWALRLGTPDTLQSTTPKTK